jgi:hypothetical protein
LSRGIAASSEAIKSHQVTTDVNISKFGGIVERCIASLVKQIDIHALRDE